MEVSVSHSNIKNGSYDKIIFDC